MFFKDVYNFKKMNPERMRKQMWWLRKPKIISDVENNRACQAAREFHSHLMLIKTNFSFAVKTIDLGSYLKVSTGIKKKKLHKKFFLLVRNFHVWHFDFSDT